MFKKYVIETMKNIEFDESVTVKKKCPKCGGEVERRIRKEQQQKMRGRWYIEHCLNDECPYWDCGFVNQRWGS